MSPEVENLKNQIDAFHESVASMILNSLLENPELTPPLTSLNQSLIQCSKFCDDIDELQDKTRIQDLTTQFMQALLYFNSNEVDKTKPEHIQTFIKKSLQSIETQLKSLAESKRENRLLRKERKQVASIPALQIAQAKKEEIIEATNQLQKDMNNFYKEVKDADLSRESEADQNLQKSLITVMSDSLSSLRECETMFSDEDNTTGWSEAQANQLIEKINHTKQSFETAITDQDDSLILKRIKEISTIAINEILNTSRTMNGTPAEAQKPPIQTRRPHKSKQKPREAREEDRQAFLDKKATSTPPATPAKEPTPTAESNVEKKEETQSKDADPNTPSILKNKEHSDRFLQFLDDIENEIKALPEKHLKTNEAQTLLNAITGSKSLSNLNGEQKFKLIDEIRELWTSLKRNLPKPVALDNTLNTTAKNDPETRENFSEDAEKPKNDVPAEVPVELHAEQQKIRKKEKIEKELNNLIDRYLDNKNGFDKTIADDIFKKLEDLIITLDNADDNQLDSVKDQIKSVKIHLEAAIELAQESSMNEKKGKAPKKKSDLEKSESNKQPTTQGNREQIYVDAIEHFSKLLNSMLAQAEKHLNITETTASVHKSFQTQSLDQITIYQSNISKIRDAISFAEHSGSKEAYQSLHGIRNDLTKLRENCKQLSILTETKNNLIVEYLQLRPDESPGSTFEAQAIHDLAVEVQMENDKLGGIVSEDAVTANLSLIHSFHNSEENLNDKQHGYIQTKSKDTLYHLATRASSSRPQAEELSPEEIETLNTAHEIDSLREIIHSLNTTANHFSSMRTPKNTHQITRAIGETQLMLSHAHKRERYLTNSLLTTDLDKQINTTQHRLNELQVILDSRNIQHHESGNLSQDQIIEIETLHNNIRANSEALAVLKEQKNSLDVTPRPLDTQLLNYLNMGQNTNPPKTKHRVLRSFYYFSRIHNRQPVSQSLPAIELIAQEIPNVHVMLASVDSQLPLTTQDILKTSKNHTEAQQRIDERAKRIDHLRGIKNDLKGHVFEPEQVISFSRTKRLGLNIGAKLNKNARTKLGHKNANDDVLDIIYHAKQSRSEKAQEAGFTRAETVADPVMRVFTKWERELRTQSGERLFSPKESLSPETIQLLDDMSLDSLGPNLLQNALHEATAYAIYLLAQIQDNQDPTLTEHYNELTQNLQHLYGHYKPSEIAFHQSGLDSGEKSQRLLEGSEYFSSSVTADISLIEAAQQALSTLAPPPAKKAHHSPFPSIPNFTFPTMPWNRKKSVQAPQLEAEMEPLDPDEYDFAEDDLGPADLKLTSPGSSLNANEIKRIKVPFEVYENAQDRADTPSYDIYAEIDTVNKVTQSITIEDNDPGQSDLRVAAIDAVFTALVLGVKEPIEICDAEHEMMVQTYRVLIENGISMVMPKEHTPEHFAFKEVTESMTPRFDIAIAEHRKQNSRTGTSVQQTATFILKDDAQPDQNYQFNRSSASVEENVDAVVNSVKKSPGPR